MNSSVSLKQTDANTNDLTKPLSAQELVDFQTRFVKRLEKVKTKTDDVFAFKKVDFPPFIVSGAFYWVFGQERDTFPIRYFDDPAVMTHFQTRIYYDQLKEIDDDFVPYLMPWFGTGVAASALGCQIEFLPQQDPTANPRSYPVRTADDIHRLPIANPQRDGLMPKVLAFQRYMKSHSSLPVGITDLQGPLTTANQLMGYDQLIYLMQDNPRAVHELMEKITETLLGWISAQKTIIGEPLNECFSDQQIYVGKHAGIWLSDDDAVIMSPKTYREFVVPYNARILQTFGGGCLHYCGNATHQADNFLATEGLLAINNCLLHNLKAFRELQVKVKGRLALFACDFTPLDYEPYFRLLLDEMDYEGLVVDSIFSPTVALLGDGKYAAVHRDARAGRRAVYDFLRPDLTRAASCSNGSDG